LGTGLNTRSISDKTKIDSFYKIVIENQGKTNPTLRTSIPTRSFKFKSNSL